MHTSRLLVGVRCSVPGGSPGPGAPDQFHLETREGEIASNDGDGFQLSLSDEHAIERIAVFCLEGRGSDRLGNTDRSGCHAQLGVMGQPPQDHVGVQKNSHGLEFMLWQGLNECIRNEARNETRQPISFSD
jgi:hypothetical protein